MDRRAHLRTELARQGQELDGVARWLERPPQRCDAFDDLGVRRVTGRRESRQVALDVGDEDRNPSLRQLAGHQLERLGLARPGRARDQAVAIEHAERDLDARVVGELAIDHRAAEYETRLGQRIAGRHRVVERLVHRSSGVAEVGLRAAGKRIIGRRPGRREV